MPASIKYGSYCNTPCDEYYIKYPKATSIEGFVKSEVQWTQKLMNPEPYMYSKAERNLVPVGSLSISLARNNVLT